eukprot:scaffold3942_cov123-Isochrysis_galbana.AAC.1
MWGRRRGSPVSRAQRVFPSKLHGVTGRAMRKQNAREDTHPRPAAHNARRAGDGSGGWPYAHVGVGRGGAVKSVVFRPGRQRPAAAPPPPAILVPPYENNTQYSYSTP